MDEARRNPDTLNGENLTEREYGDAGAEHRQQCPHITRAQADAG